MTTKKMGVLPLVLLFFGIGWTVLLTALLAWSIKKERQQNLELATEQARAFFQQIRTTRYWNAGHGGVYVPITTQMQPNPYLDDPDRDVVTTGGMALTKINPAFMTRQLADIAEKKDRVRFHITSLNPLRPGNMADLWEIAALESFSAGSDEKFEFIETNTGQKVFRYMAPLWVESACLKCHAKQGYREGDLRGGISISAPAQFLTAYQSRKLFSLVLAYAFVWLGGLGACAVGMNALFRKLEVMRKSQLSAMLLAEQERERKRLGRELHDSIGQSLSAIKYSLEHALDELNKKPATAQDTRTLEPIVGMIQGTIGEVRRIVMDLRPSILDDLGILATISWFCREFETIYSGVHIEKRIEVEEAEIPAPLKIVIFRILQEALNNAAKHSRADNMGVVLENKNGRLALRIQDDGSGFDAEDIPLIEKDGSRYGLASMKERTELSGGSFSIQSIRGAGTTVRAEWRLSGFKQQISGS